MKRVEALFLLSSPTYLLSSTLLFVCKLHGGSSEQSYVTLLSLQEGLGETRWYQFTGAEESGTIDVTYQSLEADYSLISSCRFPLAQSSISCLCDCPEAQISVVHRQIFVKTGQTLQIITTRVPKQLDASSTSSVYLWPSAEILIYLFIYLFIGGLLQVVED